MTVQQELVPGRESCGRDIRITFTIQNTSLGPLVARGTGRWRFFKLFDGPRGRSASVHS